MTPEQRYLLDINGYLLIPDAVEPGALAAARSAAYEATAAQKGSLSGEAFAFDVYSHPAIASLAFTPKAWPVVLELTNGQPMMRLGIGIHDAPRSGGGGMLHCNGEFQRSSAVGSPSMASYAVNNGKIYCADFGMFVYLDTVEPGDGGLLLVNGSHKSRFERPASIGGTYGKGNWPAPLGLRGASAAPAPHGDNRALPPHTVNPCPRAGDILIMSERTAHANMAWRGAGHRHVLRVGFKPQHTSHPEEGFTDQQILGLPPEIRELRKHAALGQIKAIAAPGRGPITRLSPPDPSVPVTDDERTHGPAAGRLGQGAEAGHLPFALRSPGLPPIPGGMSEEQRYLFDCHGYCHLKNAITGAELAACQKAAADYVHTPQEQLPEGFGQTPGGKFLHAHAWAPCLERLATHPSIWPTILELTDGKPKLLHESGTLFWEDARRSEELATKGSYDASRDMHVSVAGRDGVHLHCGREGLFGAGLQYSPTDCGYFEAVHGRLHCGNFAVFVYLSEVKQGDGGLLVVEGSHKAAFERPRGDIDGGLFAPFGGGNPVPAAAVDQLGSPPWDHRTAVGLRNVVPIEAGDVLVMPEALTHGVMPWAMAPGRMRQMLIFRYEPQWSGSLGQRPPPLVAARLSPGTHELMEYAHISHTKDVAKGWRDTLLWRGQLEPAAAAAAAAAEEEQQGGLTPLRPRM